MPVVVGRDESVYKKLTCRHCGSINHEVRTLWSGKDYSDGAEGFYFVNCGEEVIVRAW